LASTTNTFGPESALGLVSPWGSAALLLTQVATVAKSCADHDRTVAREREGHSIVYLAVEAVGCRLVVLIKISWQEVLVVNLANAPACRQPLLLNVLLLGGGRGSRG
jgi:hypothetical protein